MPGRLITTDCHVGVPYEVIDELPQSCRQYFPRDERRADGDYWVKPTGSDMMGMAEPDIRVEGDAAVRMSVGAADEARPSFEPEAVLADLERDGVYGAVLISRIAGRGIAYALAKEGASVAMIDLNADGALQTVDQIAADGGVGPTPDLRHPRFGSRARRGGQGRPAFWTVDILVNNATQAHGGVRFEDISDDDLDLVFRTGPMATIFFMRT